MGRVSTDPYLWLEDITGEDALDWVRARNAPTVAEFAGEEFEARRAAALEVLDTDARIPYVRRRGDHLYNFWRDATNPRGLWRRTTLESYRSENPAWEVLIDVDELGRRDDTNWVWAGADVIEPERTRALVALSAGGSDAAIVCEFDMATGEFIEDGFRLPEAKSHLSWLDHDTVLVGTDFGPDSLTDSGYPRMVKRWRRGQPLAEAQTVFTGAPGDVIVAARADRTPGFERTFIRRAIDFFNDEVYELREQESGEAELVRIDAPTDATVSVHRQWLLIELRSEWLTGTASYRAGSLLAADYDQFLAGSAALRVVFEPDDHTALHHYAWTRDALVVVTLCDVASRVQILTPGDWTPTPVPEVPANTTVTIVATDATDASDNEIFLDYSGFTSPSRLLHGSAGGPLTEIKAAPAFFDADGIGVTQHFATSRDGTAVPYFVVRPADASGPTLLGGYGGFEVARTPDYDGVLGRLWLARGGTYVLANIRGGGEYGPRWHTQAMRENRHKVAEDFAAVAADLVERGITTPGQLGAQGGSNGGLLMGIMLTAYPQLFGALVCGVPLLDMRRYHLLLAGASWVAEYGNPDDPDDWEFIEKYSPYHNISAEAAYPALLMTSSTRDDRVHPGHARKMTAALEAAGHRVRYYENIEGGHAGAADNAQTAFKVALSYSFLWAMLAGPS
ncbi:prolyl oligopeptidase [Mycolicibacillus koreensis]|nr:prolyl oligopeptidase [Mycolicibacillus koreensis]